MEGIACASSCMFTSLKRLIRGYFGYLIAAAVFGAVFGLFYAGGAGALAGAGFGALLAIVYGYIPRMVECVGACPIR